MNAIIIIELMTISEAKIRVRIGRIVSGVLLIEARLRLLIAPP
jgi:hypothetical protein